MNLLGDAGNIIAAERDAETGKDYYFYNKDIRSSTTSVLDSSGNCANSYEYSDFGETTVHGDLYNEICYTGGIYDANTGLYYLNARYYDPADKRFLTEDTYRGSENDPNTLHLYAYCANNPVNYVDPSGHFALSTGAIAALTAALIAATAYMSTPEFQQSWRDFCTTIDNGLSSIGNQLRKGAQKVWNGTKSYVQKVQTSVQAYTTVANAQSKIREKVRNKKHGSKYFAASLKKSGKYSYVAIGKALTLNQAICRVKAQNNIFAVDKPHAFNVAKRFSGVVGPEIDKGKASTIGYYYHYHVWNRRNQAHIWFFGV